MGEVGGLRLMLLADGPHFSTVDIVCILALLASCISIALNVTAWTILIYLYLRRQDRQEDSALGVTMWHHFNVAVIVTGVWIATAFDGIGSLTHTGVRFKPILLCLIWLALIVATWVIVIRLYRQIRKRNEEKTTLGRHEKPQQDKQPLA